MKQEIISNLLTINNNYPVYLTGGIVRDFLLQRISNDIDLTLDADVLKIARDFAGFLKGAFIPLDEDEGVARVVVDDLVIDFTSFRCGAKTIEKDLEQRDFTINAMAIALSDIMDKLPLIFEEKKNIIISPEKIIDPFCGAGDINKRIIKAVRDENFLKDPLRLLRAFRFMAELDFEIDEVVLELINNKAGLIINVSPERITQELDKIMQSKKAGFAFDMMQKNAILFHVIPEFSLMQGIEQPLFHHLDVLGHSIEALFKIEELIDEPEKRFEYPDRITKWIKKNSNLISVKWSALFHDLGKPDCKKMRNEDKITFYRHDIHGSKMCNVIGRRLRWPVHRIHLVSSLVRFHMRPFHLLNTLKFNGPTKRALRRLLKEVSEDYPGLFLLAMADEMSGCGPLKPADLHIDLSRIWKIVHEFYIENEEILSRKKRLLNGQDIQKILSVSPGPLVGKAINAIEEAQIIGLIHNREQAINWLIKWYENRAISHS